MNDQYSSGNHIVTGKRNLTESTFVLTFTRGNMQFTAGQRILAGIKGDIDQRDYSIYSGEDDESLEILVKEIDEGNVSLKLRNCEPGHLLNISGPYGSFTIKKEDMNTSRLIFIATGTGISPFHSFVRTYSDIDYLLIHGIRYKEETYDREQYDPGRYITCTSQEASQGKKTRVTDFISGFRITPDMLFYLCGNGRMIYDVSRILLNKGVPAGSIFSEIYFA
ncbi:MAG TPA: FAD-binding oxidoreductase [Bacteroidales bacterium]|nr:FAD-binding oxidoreductase [Bacteroidales bacterium]